jgi:glycosyltransferase involved in cell wall biosynthesis
MKVAFYTYPSAFQNVGGGEVQLLKTKEALEKKGIEVKLFDQWEDKLDNFDILHIFGSVKDCLGLMETARNKNIKIALSTVFCSTFKRAIWESRDTRTRIEQCLRHLAKILFPVFPSEKRKMMLISDVLLPNSAMESLSLKKLFALKNIKMQVVPNCVDEWFRDADPKIFIDKYGLKDFALAVGRIEPRKNQLNLIKALSGTDKNLVIIGDPVSDYLDYYKKCKEISGKNIYFLPSLKHLDPLLKSAYAASSIFVAPAWFETTCLAALEAGLAGTRVAITKYGYTKEYYKDMVGYFDPASVYDIRKTILSMLCMHKTEDLKNHIYKNYTWDKAAEATIAAYHMILK